MYHRLGYSLFLCFALCLVSASQANEPPKTNVIVMITDDQRVEDFSIAMPKLAERAAREALSFSRAYVTTPMCCPSRASILTGRYASNHGVKTNDLSLEGETIVHLFAQHGYKTGLVGKYLNSWLGEKRAEFDYWVSFRKGTSRYQDPELNIQGEWREEKGYITFILEGFVREFLKQRGRDRDPFLLVFAPNAPHAPLQAAPGQESLFADLTPYRPPNFNLLHESKPSFLRSTEPLTSLEIDEIDLFRRQQAQTLFALDQTIDRIFSELREQNLSENTVIIFLSDNGVLWGEFGLQRKVSPYEPSVKVPMLLFDPTRVLKARSSDALVANIDIAPTLCELAGLEPKLPFDGYSLLPLVDGRSKSVREFLFLENWRESRNRKPFVAVHTGEMVLVDNRGPADELYDLDSDPYQMVNLIDDPNWQPKVKQLRRILAERETR